MAQPDDFKLIKQISNHGAGSCWLHSFCFRLQRPHLSTTLALALLQHSWRFTVLAGVVA
jgi:hypothetical protein